MYVQPYVWLNARINVCWQLLGTAFTEYISLIGTKIPWSISHVIPPSLNFHMFLPTWHKNSMIFLTWKSMESPLKISRVFFLTEFHGTQHRDPYSVGSPPPNLTTVGVIIYVKTVQLYGCGWRRWRRFEVVDLRRLIGVTATERTSSETDQMTTHRQRHRRVSSDILQPTTFSLVVTCPVAAPRAWISLPSSVPAATSLITFRR